MGKTWTVEELNEGYLIIDTGDGLHGPVEQTSAKECPIDVVGDLLDWLSVRDYELVRKEERDVKADVVGG